MQSAQGMSCARSARARRKALRQRVLKAARAQGQGGKRWV